MGKKTAKPIRKSQKLQNAKSLGEVKTLSERKSLRNISPITTLRRAGGTQ